MRNIFKIAGLIILAPIVFYLLAGFMIKDPPADLVKAPISLTDEVLLKEIKTANPYPGEFVNTVDFTLPAGQDLAKEFYGQAIKFTGNDQFDKLLIGITSNHIARVELWQQDKLVAEKEMGFVGKMTWGNTQTLRVAFTDGIQTGNRPAGIVMRFYENHGFFGDIGTVSFDLTGYGRLDGARSIGVFARPLVERKVKGQPVFSNLQIWQHYHAFD